MTITGKKGGGVVVMPDERITIYTTDNKIKVARNSLPNGL